MEYHTWLTVGAVYVLVFKIWAYSQLGKSYVLYTSNMKGKYCLLFIMFCYLLRNVGPEVAFSFVKHGSIQSADAN